MQEPGELIVVSKAVSQLPALAVPASIAVAGAAASFAWDEFFLGQVRNPHTRAAYLVAVPVYPMVDVHNVELARITPGMVGHYFNELQLSIPSRKVHLAAIRAFFDVLVQRHVLVLNPGIPCERNAMPQLKGRLRKSPSNKPGNCSHQSN